MGYISAELTKCTPTTQSVCQAQEKAKEPTHSMRSVDKKKQKRSTNQIQRSS